MLRLLEGKIAEMEDPQHGTSSLENDIRLLEVIAPPKRPPLLHPGFPFNLSTVLLLWPFLPLCQILQVAVLQGHHALSTIYQDVLQSQESLLCP